jgi:hypothetical protein
VGRERVEYAREEVVDSPCEGEFEAEEYRYLIVPDVALQKARLVQHALRGKADVWSNNSFGFAREKVEGILGRVEEIERIEKFDPKALKRELRGVGVDILVREFPMSVDQVRQRTGMRSGAERRIALTRIKGQAYTIFLK